MSSIRSLSKVGSRAVTPVDEILTSSSFLRAFANNVETDGAFKIALDKDKSERGYASDATGACKKSSFGRGVPLLSQGGSLERI